MQPEVGSYLPVKLPLPYRGVIQDNPCTLPAAVQVLEAKYSNSPLRSE